MKALASFLAGLTLCAASLSGTGTPAPITLPAGTCLYYAETPTETQAFYGLVDAQNYLRGLGIDPNNVPEGYDITSKAGC